jgi:hypothetical protein
MLKRYKSALVMASILLFIFSGCTKDTTVYLNNGAEVTTPVSFSKEMVPIFAKSCAVSGCHSSGGQAPDLTSERAYNSLINGSYVDLAQPEKSDIYLWETGVEKPAMPIGAANNPANINGLTLAWIKQGAKNN